MFGTGKKIEAAVSAVKDESKRKALAYFDKEVKNMRGNGALAWLRGALELARELELLSDKEIAQIDKIGVANFEAIQKANREEREKALAAHKAERAAKAKAAKEGK